MRDIVLKGAYGIAGSVLGMAAPAAHLDEWIRVLAGIAGLIVAVGSAVAIVLSIRIKRRELYRMDHDEHYHPHDE